MKKFAFITIAGLALAGCAQQPPTSEAGMAGRAFAVSHFLQACPNHIKIKPDMRVYYNERLREGRRLIGNDLSNTMLIAKNALKKPGACEKLARGYSNGSHTFLINK